MKPRVVLLSRAPDRDLERVVGKLSSLGVSVVSWAFNSHDHDLDVEAAPGWFRIRRFDQCLSTLDLQGASAVVHRVNSGQWDRPVVQGGRGAGPRLLGLRPGPDGDAPRGVALGPRRPVSAAPRPLTSLARWLSYRGRGRRTAIRRRASEQCGDNEYDNSKRQLGANGGHLLGRSRVERR